MDTLIINELTLSTQIGVHDWEQRIKQKVILDIAIYSDFSTCQDDIKRTIDYDSLCQTLTKWVESNSFRLIETLAHEVADLIQREFQVTQLTVTVSKPHAIKNAGPIQVKVTKGN